MKICSQQFSSMKKFSFEEAQKMLGACALTFVEIVNTQGEISGKAAVWKSLLADFWVKANVSEEVMYGNTSWEGEKTETPPQPITGNGYFGH